MSLELPGSERCMIYHLHFVGGPKDGEVVNAYRPYYRMQSEGMVYQAKSEELDEFLEWVDDWTRKITLYHKESNREQDQIQRPES